MRSVFHATAGFLGRVGSETQCAFWAEEPVDHGFGTTFGPRWPELRLAGFDPAFAHLLTEASATHPAIGTAGSRHGRSSRSS